MPILRGLSRAIRRHVDGATLSWADAARQRASKSTTGQSIQGTLTNDVRYFPPEEQEPLKSTVAAPSMASALAAR